MLTGYIKLFLLTLMPLFLISCAQKAPKIVRVEVSPHLLEECKVPARKRYRNDGLRDYTVKLHESLLKCNADKRAIKKELGQ